MKRMLEKIKANKVRSTLIGLSAFLFGFISVSIFNNIGDTYALLTCDPGWNLISEATKKCCPDNFGYASKDKKCISTANAEVDKTKCGTMGGNWDDDAKNCTVSAKNAIDQVITRTASFKLNSGGKSWINVAGYYAREGVVIGTCDATATGKCTVRSPIPKEASDVLSFSGYSTDIGCKTVIAGSTNSIVISDNTSFYACYDQQEACYLCGRYLGAKFVWGEYYNNAECTLHSDKNTPGACTGSNATELSATFNVTDGGSLSGNTTASCNTTTKNPTACKVEAPTATKAGDKFLGWATSKAACTNNYQTPSSSGEIWLDYTTNGNLYTCWGTDSPNPGNYNANLATGESAYTRNIYKVIYNPNGGMFIDGTTQNRVTYIPSDLAIGDPETNPIKDGYKFKEWQLNGTKFDFSQKPTSDITLNAVYEELSDDDKLYYCENKNHVLDVTSKLCYNVLKADNDSTYNYTLYKYSEGATFCYAASASKPGGIYFRNDINMDNYLEIEGKDDEPYSGYDKQEEWVTEDTCKIATECTETNQTIDYPACQIKWSAIIYSSINAKIKSQTFEENSESTIVPGDELGDNPDDGQDGEKSDKDDSDEEKTDDKPSNDKTDEDLTDKDAADLKTGDALIIIAWLVGLGALGYTAYYFIKKNKEN